jgi:hypothetical protein
MHTSSQHAAHIMHMHMQPMMAFNAWQEQASTA